MAQTYRIRSGAMFVLHDGRLLGAGALVELEDDVAQAHAEKLESVLTLAADVLTDGEPPPEPDGEQS